MRLYTCLRGSSIQQYLLLDLDDDNGIEQVLHWMPKEIEVVYSDPPWNPGNASYWRTHAKQGPCTSYPRFVDRLVRIYAECQQRGAKHVMVEQSANLEHSNILMDAVGRCQAWRLPFTKRYPVIYNRPPRPNAVLHFGETPLETDPEGLTGEAMVIRAIAGTKIRPGQWMLDSCIGKGTTSRVAHYFQANCFGAELNETRLEITLNWLRKQGYDVTSKDFELPCP